MSDLHIDKLDFDALMDEAEAKHTYDECPSCGEMHMLCPVCGVCLKYCHDDYFHDEGYLQDPYYEASGDADEYADDALDWAGDNE